MVMESLAISEKNRLARYVSEQPPYNLLDRRIENELVPMCRRYGLAILPWSPLGGGVLAGKYPPGEDVPAGSRLDRIDFYKDRVTGPARDCATRIAHIAEEIDITLPQLALLWVKDQPGITAPIIGPRTMAHLEAALPVMDMTLDRRIAARLDKLNPPGSAIADFHNTAPWMKTRVS